MTPRSRRQPSDLPKHIFVFALLLVELFPIYMMAQISMKDNMGFIQNPWLPAPLSEWKWENWVSAIRLVTPFAANTIFVAVLGTIATLTCALCAAYFFARYKMPFGGILWAGFLFLMLMPGVANIVPLFMLIKQMNLLNTLWALIIIGIAGGQVFNMFVLRNFIEDIPKDLFEAAEMDGASHFQQIRNIVVPMSGPILGTLCILAFLGKWNDFLMPLIILRDPELFTIGVGLIYLNSEYVKEWGQIMAAFSVASVPLVIMFLFTMKLFVRGLSAGAVKG